MATASQSDPREEMLVRLQDKINLDDQARALIESSVRSVDINILSSPAEIARAMESMDILAAHLTKGRFASPRPIGQNEIRMALRDLCPLFPIC